MIQWFYPQCQRIYVPSQSMIKELEVEGISGDMKIWARGIDTKLFSPVRRDQHWREKMGFAEDDIVVSFVSRLVWEKELGTYIESERRIQQRHPKGKALVVGDGPAKQEAQEKLPNGVFIGFCSGENLARAYASSDLFLFPSYTETFGNVTLEAMACGVPCLVANAIGSSSLVIDGENGRLAKPGDILDFSNKLEQMIFSRSTLLEMGLRSRKLALEYKWDQINELLISDYKSVISDFEPTLN